MSNEMVLISKTELVTLLENAVKSALNGFTETIKENPLQSNDELLNQQSACKLLDVSEGTLISWKKQGKIPYKKINKRCYYSRESLMKLLEV